VHTGTSGPQAASAAADAAAAGADLTAHMVVALAGRASYVPGSALADVPDPGAMAVSVWLRAIAAALE
jgi:dihydroxyacetone kinase